MSNKLAKTLSSQQVNDAQHLDEMTSLQLFNLTEHSLLVQYEVCDEQSTFYCIEELQFKSKNHKGWL